MGTIMAVVAVLLIHMDRNAVEIMKPNNSLYSGWGEGSERMSKSHWTTRARSAFRSSILNGTGSSAIQGEGQTLCWKQVGQWTHYLASELSVTLSSRRKEGNRLGSESNYYVIYLWRCPAILTIWAVSQQWVGLAEQSACVGPTSPRPLLQWDRPQTACSCPDNYKETNHKHSGMRRACTSINLHIVTMVVTLVTLTLVKRWNANMDINRPVIIWRQTTGICWRIFAQLYSYKCSTTAEGNKTNSVYTSHGMTGEETTNHRTTHAPWGSLCRSALHPRYQATA